MDQFCDLNSSKHSVDHGLTIRRIVFTRPEIAE